MTALERELSKRLHFDCPYKGVILITDFDDLTPEEEKKLTEWGDLILKDGDIVKVEDQETGLLMEGRITITHPDFFLFDVYDKNGKIIHEEEVPLYVYLAQLDARGALDAYPNVDYN